MIAVAAIINFLIVVFVLYYFGKGPIRTFLTGRSETVAKDIKEAEHLFNDVSAEHTRWEKSLAGFEAEVKTYQDQAKQQLAKQKSEMMAFATKESERIRRDAKTMGETEKQRMLSGLNREIANRSIQAAELYLKDHFSEKDQSKCLTEYLEIVTDG